MGTRLTRVVGRIFGSSAGPDQIGVFGSLFAGSQNTTTSPSVAQSLSNWLTGWNAAAIGGNAPAIEDMNAAFFVHSHQIAYLLQSGVPEWNTDTFYYSGNIVNISGILYISLTDDNQGNNPVVDTVNWKLFSFDATATGKDFWGSVLPAGWIWADGKTIGNTSSNATNRANSDTFDLYKIFWDNYSNSLLPIYDSAGAPTTRGASAAADFSANKAIAVIDKRGRVSVGRDNIGGTSASRITSTTVLPNGTTLGASGGTQTHTLTIGEMPTHTHLQDSHGHAFSVGNGNDTLSGVPRGVQPNVSYTINTSSVTATNQNEGGGGAHNNVQPSILCNYIIKL